MLGVIFATILQEDLEPADGHTDQEGEGDRSLPFRKGNRVNTRYTFSMVGHGRKVWIQMLNLK